MNDMRAVIVPNSDQINADDLLAGPMTITVTNVTIRPGTEQPVSIFFDGDGGKPYKPCKSMARVMVQCWGPDANDYIGRSMTLYNDPKVQWGGMAVGGIRISHMSDIKGVQHMALTATKGKKAPFTVQPLKVAAPPQQAAQKPGGAPPTRTARMFLDDLERDLAAAQESMDARSAVRAILDSDDVKRAEKMLTNGYKARLTTMVESALAAIAEIDPPKQAAPDDDAFPGDPQ